MIAQDLELLGVVRRLNTEMGDIVTTLLEETVDGQLPAHKLRELAGIARDLADALEGRADDISPPGRNAPRVIDGTIVPPADSGEGECP